MFAWPFGYLHEALQDGDPNHEIAIGHAMASNVA
jgi:hypothetical protein